MPPVGTEMHFSPLISMLTLPSGTSIDLANRMIATSTRMMVTKNPTPRMISVIVLTVVVGGVD